MSQAVALATLGSSGYSLGIKNRVINGAMTIDQRNNGSLMTISSSGANYPVDRFSVWKEVSAGTLTAQQVTDAPPGFTRSLRCTVVSTFSAASNQAVMVRHWLEGVNTADLGWGTANAQPVTLSFWVKSSIAGQHSGSMVNGPLNRAYAYNYTINSANTWEFKSITVPGDTSGVWATDTAGSIRMYWHLGSGSGYLTSTPNTWLAGGQALGTTTSVNLSATAGATFQLTGVQLEEGTVATPFEYRHFTVEQLLCQRYYEYGTASGSGYAAVTAVFDAGAAATINFKASKRIAPTMTAPSIAGSTYPNVTSSRAVPDYEGGFSRGFRYIDQNSATFWNVTTGAGGSTGVANFRIVWIADAEVT